MQRPRNAAQPLLDPLGLAEYMVNAFADGAKMCWRWWGPLGEPMIRLTEEWADTQRRYLRSLQESLENGGRPSGLYHYLEVARNSTKEAKTRAEESAEEAKKSAEEAKRIAKEAERNAGEE